MNGTPKTIAGPSFVSNAVADIYAPPASTIISLLRQIHLANITNSAQNVSLYRGGTGASLAGTEVCKGLSIPANEVRDLFFDDLVMKSTDFLTGVAGAINSTTITVIGHQIVTP